MPNHVVNEVTVKGSKDQIEAIRKKYFSTYEKEKNEPEQDYFDFNKIYQYPESYKKQDEIARVNNDALMKGDKSKTWIQDGYNQGGYEWCVSNWGTKWNSYDYRKLVVRTKGRKAVLRMTFSTAWSAPTPVLKKLAELEPEVTIAVKSFDGGGGWKQTFKAKGTDVAIVSGPYSGSKGG